MGSIEKHHVVALEGRYCPVPDFNLGQPFDKTVYQSTTRDQVADRIRPATILLLSTVPIDAAALSEECSPNLRLISVMASGTDAVDLEMCRKRGIAVCNASRANVHAVSEHAIGLYFAARRRFQLTERALRAGDWTNEGSCMRVMFDGDGMMPTTCRDEVMGLIGFGTIGQRIAELGQALGMKTIVADRKGVDKVREGRHRFEDVLRTATVLVLILPRTPESLNLISTRELEMMQRHAVLINVARGGIVDESALVQALQRKQIAGAAFDIFFKEPAGPSNSVLATEETKDLNLLLTPHLAWAAETTIKDMISITKANVEAWYTGKPINVVC